jgi:hypothetical protein
MSQPTERQEKRKLEYSSVSEKSSWKPDCAVRIIFCIDSDMGLDLACGPGT